MRRKMLLCTAILLVMAILPFASAEKLIAEGEDNILTILVQPTPKITDIRTNDFTMWLEEQTGVKIEWTVIESDAAETVAMMLSSGEALPDVLMVNLSKDQQSLYGAQGVLMPLNDLVTEHAPHIKQAYKDYPLYAATSTSADGNIYYITAYEECFHCTASQKMWVNADWLNNVGLEMPTTTEQFKEMLIAFRDQDANGNGDPSDEIPFSTLAKSWHTNVEAYLMCAFIYDDGGDRLVVEDGVVSAAYVQDEFREGLRYINDLFSEGLIDPNAFVQDGPSMKALCSDTVRVGAVPGGHPALFLDTDNPNIFQFQALNPLVGPEGVSLCGRYPNVAKQSDGAALSSTCKNPELAIKWLDFLFTEGATIRSQYGMEGRDWAYNDDPAVKGLNDEKALFTTFGKSPVYTKTQMTEAWEHTSPFLWVDYIFAGQAVLGGEGYDLEKVLYDATKGYVSHFPDEICMNLSFGDEDAAYISSVRPMINSYVEQMIAEFIMGTSNINDDNAWQSYLETLKNMDLDNYLSVMQKGYTQQQEVIKALSK